MLTLANTGVPMLIVVGPVLLLALVPIALVEAVLYRSRIGVAWKEAMWGSLVANVLSTVVGVPLTWLALVALQLVTGGGGGRGVGIQAVTWQAPWLIPYREHLHWMIPAAALVLCIPFLLVSVFVECLFLCRRWKQIEPGKIRLACWLGNGLTYGCLMVFWAVQLTLSDKQ